MKWPPHVRAHIRPSTRPHIRGHKWLIKPHKRAPHIREHTRKLWHTCILLLIWHTCILLLIWRSLSPPPTQVHTASAILPNQCRPLRRQLQGLVKEKTALEDTDAFVRGRGRESVKASGVSVCVDVCVIGCYRMGSLYVGFRFDVCVIGCYCIDLWRFICYVRLVIILVYLWPCVLHEMETVCWELICVCVCMFVVDIGHSLDL